MRRKTVSKGLLVLLLLAILAIAIVILVKVNKKSNSNNTKSTKKRMGVDEACSNIPNVEADICAKWKNQPGGFTKKGYVYCDDEGDCTWGADALNCCACDYPKTVPGSRCGTPPN